MNNTQQLKPDPKGKAIASFTLGILIIIIYYIFSWTWPPKVSTAKEDSPLYLALIFLLPILFMIAGVIGLALGRMGARSPSIVIKIIAAIGMISCILFGIYMGFGTLLGTLLWFGGIGR